LVSCSVCETNEERGEIIVRNPRSDEREPPKTFTFDSVFGPNVTQRHVYEVCGAPLVESVLDGYNGTIFAYGQTGAGKTHTMEGRPDNADLRGIIPNSFQHIFDQVCQYLRIDSNLLLFFTKSNSLFVSGGFSAPSSAILG